VAEALQLVRGGEPGDPRADHDHAGPRPPTPLDGHAADRPAPRG
jgi:hypothetical protein